MNKINPFLSLQVYCIESECAGSLLYRMQQLDVYYSIVDDDNRVGSIITTAGIGNAAGVQEDVTRAVFHP